MPPDHRVVLARALATVTDRAEAALARGDRETATMLVAVARIFFGHPIAPALSDFDDWRRATLRLAPVARFLADADPVDESAVECEVFRVLRDAHARVMRQRMRLVPAGACA